MEARIAKLEATTEHIQADITDLKQDVRELRSDTGKVRDAVDSNLKWTLGAFGTTAVLLAGIMAKGFGWLN